MRRLFVLAALLFALPAHAFTVIQLTDNYAHDLDPAISGSNVAWEHCDRRLHPFTGSCWRNGGIDFWDGSTITRITDEETADGPPDISGSNVVWEKWDGFDDEIYFWMGLIPTVPIQVTDNSTDDYSPAISGSKVVWRGCDGGVGYACDGGDWEIYLWDGSFPVAPIQITDNDTADLRPAISGSNVVWQCDDGTDDEICFWDGSFPIAPIQITDNDTADLRPAISGSKVVWEHFDGSDAEIYFWDGSFPIAPIQVTDNGVVDRHPAISGSNVVWSGWDGFGFEIYMTTIPACSDGLDNDADGYIDWNGGPLGETADPGCFNPYYFTENPQCQDGIDNDGDGKMDYDAGLSANGFADSGGPDSYCDGTPWVNLESLPTCGLGVELALLLPPLMWMWRRRSR